MGKKVLPRSGFPPDNSYKVVVVGAEPRAKAKVMMTPTHYREHYIGLKHKLLILCPNDVVDIDVKDNKILGSFIRSDYGKLQIKP